MRTIFEWPGLYDIQPLIVGGTATTKTIATDAVDAYVYSGAYALKIYANDAASGKTNTGTIYLPNTEERTVRISGRFLQDNAETTWIAWAVNAVIYDGTNLHQAGLEWYSNSGNDKTVRVINSTGAFEVIASSVWHATTNYWVDFELDFLLNASGVDPTYKYLRVNEWENTTFPDNGYSNADATLPINVFSTNFKVDDGSNRVVRLDRVKLEVW